MSLEEGVPQGSPVSPLLVCLATAKLPKVVKEATPNFQVDQFADDLTSCTTETTPKQKPPKSRRKKTELKLLVKKRR